MGTGDTKATGRYILDLIHRRLPATAFGDAILTFVHVKDVAEAIVRAVEKENNVGQRYLVGKQQLSMGEFTRMISEISGVPAPAARLPGYLVTMNASLTTLLANLTKRPHIWGMSSDQLRTTREGCKFDGSKAESELGIAYTPVRVAIEEAIASYRVPQSPHLSGSGIS